MTRTQAKRTCFGFLPQLSIFGRSLLLLAAELGANIICWTTAAILFGRSKATQPVLSLSLLAWTLGLRHALDADHISAIDNATRGLINLGQLPVTCGLFFSLGHSTIVIVVTIAIAISSDIFERMAGFGTIGGIVGASVSGAFLFIIALANSIILWKIIKRRREAQKNGGQAPKYDEKETHTLTMRILGPVVQFVNRPWKMYPVGVLFGLGFDTASSIALLGVSALAKQESSTSEHVIKSGDIVILPLLFTAGMTFVDSVDSVLVLYSYSGFPEEKWAIFRQTGTSEEANRQPNPIIAEKTEGPSNNEISSGDVEKGTDMQPTEHNQVQQNQDIVKRNVMSGLSIILTLMSILVAFSISLITIMNLIGEECSQCREAAEAKDGGGLAGRWWRGWAKAASNSGYIGAAIVGAFVVIVGGWYACRLCWRKWKGEEQTQKGITQK